MCNSFFVLLDMIDWLETLQKKKDKSIRSIFY